jgi:hypothetical protein
MVTNELKYENYIDSQPEEGDSGYFGNSLTANEKYLAVGDTLAGRVVIYHRSPQNKWVRFRTVSPPAYPTRSTLYRLALAGDILVIGTITVTDCLNEQNQQFYPYRPPADKNAMAFCNEKTLRIKHTSRGLLEEVYAGAVYQTLVTSDAPLERIDDPKPRELAGFSVAADGHKIAFAVATYDESGETSGYTTVISNGHRRIFTSSGAIGLCNNLLVVGSTIDSEHGRVVIYDLATSNPSPQVVEVPISIGKTVLTDKFIAVCNLRSMYSKTLILNLTDLSIYCLDEFREFSGYGNLLFCCRTASVILERGGKMNLFDISYTPLKLLSECNPEASTGFLSKDFLFVVVHNYSDTVSSGSDEIFVRSDISRIWILSNSQATPSV